MKGHLDVKELEKCKKADLQKLAEEPEKDDEPQAAGTVKVEVTAMYLDKVLNEVKEPGEVFTVSRERAAILEKAKVAKIKE